jgi:hypothetical protein
MAAKVASSAIRSPTSRASGRAHQGGRLQSEWVADFRRNRWPDCVGITGRFASDYARLCKFFGLSEGYFLRLQNAYDTLEAKRRIAEQVAKIRALQAE